MTLKTLRNLKREFRLENEYQKGYQAKDAPSIYWHSSLSSRPESSLSLVSQPESTITWLIYDVVLSK